MCRTARAALVAAAPEPSERGDSGSSKGKDDDPKKDKKYPHDRDAASRTGSHPPSRGNKHAPQEKNPEDKTRNKGIEAHSFPTRRSSDLPREKYPEDRTRNKGIDAPRQTHAERDRQAMPPPKGLADKTGRYEHPHRRESSQTPPTKQGKGQKPNSTSVSWR